MVEAEEELTEVEADGGGVSQLCFRIGPVGRGVFCKKTHSFEMFHVLLSSFIRCARSDRFLPGLLRRK